MAQLGRPETVVYVSKELKSGLGNIKAYVRKPDGSIIGPFSLAESTHPHFSGVYSFNFETNQAVDSYGIYVGIIESSMENHRAPFKINYEQISIAELNEITSQVVEALKLMNQVESDIELESNEDEIEIIVGEGPA